MNQQQQTVQTPRDRVLVVSLMKSGTHLLQELMVALGYGMYGQSRITPDIRPALASDTRLSIAEMVYEPEEFRGIREAEGEEFTAATDRAWEALGWAWQLRFGLPLANRYGNELPHSGLVEQASRRTVASDFSATPPGVCWILPELDISRVDGRFIREWSDTGAPRIIFNYRDPRDVVLSMVNFLCGKTAAGYGNFSEFRVFSSILRDLPGQQERIRYALSDPAFPGYDAFRRSLWLLRHPQVCAVRFEDLVGPKGGGSASAQQATVARILGFLGRETSSAELVDQLYRPDSFSFYRGQIGEWRAAFGVENEKLFEDRFGDVREAYGYQN